MRILRIIISVDPAYGGPVEGLRLSATQMADLGHETEVVTLDDPGASYLEAFPFRVHALGPGWGRYRYTPNLARWISSNAGRFDVAVIHGLWNHAPIGGWRGLKQAQLPYAVFTHGMLDPWFNSVQPVKRWAKQAFWLGAQAWVLHDAQAVLFTTKEELLQAQRSFFGPSFKGEVVAYAAGDAPPAVHGAGNSFRHLLPSLEGRDFLLFLSRIHPKKGCDLLVEAFARLAPQYPDIDLVVAGPDQVGLVGKLAETAKAQGVGDRVHFPGMLQGDAKWEAFRGASAFVLPSHQENFGIVVAEAMAAGTPVLISDKVNIYREVTASEGGLAAPDTLEGTIDLLGRFLAMPAESRSEMGDKARAGYEKHFSARYAAQDLLRVLERIRRSEGMTASPQRTGD